MLFKVLSHSTTPSFVVVILYKVLRIFYITPSQLLSHKSASSGTLFVLGEFLMAQYKKSLLHVVLILFLGLLFLLSASAVPVTRGFFSKKEEVSLQTSTFEGAVDLQRFDEMFDVGEELAEGRMDLETKDYPGAGPNTHHDPNPPGRSG